MSTGIAAHYSVSFNQANQMVKNNTLARKGISAFFSIHQVNLYDCSVKKVKIAVLRRPDSCV
ncbi:conserved hypothetical protein [Klebsiella variicola]|nr:conserved hypothetical protein [Klebsiella variicola]